MKRFAVLSLSLLLLLVLIPGCFSFQTPPSAATPQATTPAGTVNSVWANPVNPVSLPAASPSSFAVTSVIASTEPRSGSGCFNLYAIITTNGPGSVSYMWESSDGGGYSYTWTITFASAGTQRITLPVEMSALPTGPYNVHVLTPNDVVSNSTYYTTCQ